ncbi:MAG: hypothetical protein Q9168_005283 [Polycauliona sp. 1 TL-2023]
MVLTTSERTLLGNCKIFFGKTRKELPDSGIKSLGELDELKGLLLRVVRVSPLSLDKVIVDLQEIIKEEKEKRATEEKAKRKKKRHLEDTAASDQKSRRAKKRKFAISAAQNATATEYSRASSIDSVHDNSNPSGASIIPVREITDVQTTRDEDTSRSPNSGDNTYLASEAASVLSVEAAQTPITPLDLGRIQTPTSGHPESLSKQHGSSRSCSLDTHSDHTSPAATVSVPPINLPLLSPAIATPSTMTLNRVTAALDSFEEDSTSSTDTHHESSTSFSNPPQPTGPSVDIHNTSADSNNFSTRFSSPPQSPTAHPLRSTPRAGSSKTPDPLIISSRTSQLEAVENVKGSTTANNPATANDPAATNDPATANNPATANDPATANVQPIISTEMDPEMAIFTEDADMKKLLRDHFMEELYPKYRKRIHFNKVADHIKKVLELCPMLLFDRVKDSIVEFTQQRRERPGSRAPIGDISVDAEPAVVADLLSRVRVDSSDNKLHRIFQQIMLVKTIDNKVNGGYVPETRLTMAQIPKPQRPDYYIEEMAQKRFDGQPNRVKDEAKRLHRDRTSGILWQKMTNKVGGTGILFVVVFAGM